MNPIRPQFSVAKQRSANHSMSVSMPSAKITFAGCATTLVAFAILFLGEGAIGGGHGSATIWFVGLGVAALSGLLMLAGVIRSAAKKSERTALLPTIIAAITITLLWLNFFTITEWLSSIIYR